MSNNDSFNIAVSMIKEKLHIDNKQVMYVYFTDQGLIKCISPVEDLTLDSNLLKTEMQLTQVKHLVEGKANIAQFRIKKTKGKVPQYEIVAKKTNILPNKKLNRTLSKIFKKNVKKWDLQISLFLSSKKVEFKLSQDIITEFKSNTQDLSLANINGLQVLSFYITQLDSPHILVKSIDVKVSDLLNRPVVFDLDIDISKYDIYTKPIFKIYSYKEIA
jgi:hypothetical protein